MLPQSTRQDLRSDPRWIALKNRQVRPPRGPAGPSGCALSPANCVGSTNTSPLLVLDKAYVRSLNALSLEPQLLHEIREKHMVLEAGAT